VVVAVSLISVVVMVSAIVVSEAELDDVSSIVVDLVDVSITVVVGDVKLIDSVDVDDSILDEAIDDEEEGNVVVREEVTLCVSGDM